MQVVVTYDGCARLIFGVSAAPVIDEVAALIPEVRDISRCRAVVAKVFGIRRILRKVGNPIILRTARAANLARMDEIRRKEIIKHPPIQFFCTGEGKYTNKTNTTLH